MANNIDKAPQRGEVLKRTGSEAEIENSMRLWYAMKDERDVALAELAETRTKLVEAQAEKAVYIGRNLDLERKFETMLVEFTRMKTLLEAIGQQGDSISLAVSEVLAISRQSSSSTHNREAVDDLLKTQGANEVRPQEGETLQDVARRLPQESPAGFASPNSAGKEPPEWLNSNSPSPKPLSSTPTTGDKPDETYLPPRWRK